MNVTTIHQEYRRRLRMKRALSPREVILCWEHLEGDKWKPEWHIWLSRARLIRVLNTLGLPK